MSMLDSIAYQLALDASKARGATQCLRRGTMSRLCLQLDDELILGECAINGDRYCSSTEGSCGCPHAEQKLLVSLLKGRGDNYDQMILLTTLEPCVQCANLIALVGIRKVAWLQTYGNGEGRKILRNHGIACITPSEPFTYSTV